MNRRHAFLSSLLLLSLWLLLLSPCAANAQGTGTARGAKCHAITVDAFADDDVRYAATQLQQLLKEGGLDLPVVTSGRRRYKHGVIYVGHSEISPADSYRMIGDGDRMMLVGSGKKGALYAVYDFLEHFCGYRLYAPDALVVADVSELTIPVANIVERPAFDYREVAYYFPNHSRLYADWHRLHTAEDRSGRWGMFVHTFNKLLPADVYFDEHPEWFSLRDGQRVRDGQLCLSNPQVLDALCGALADAIANDEGDHRGWSVSPNDNYNVCQCGECRRLDSLYGGPTGTLLTFVNQVARRFPEYTISTLAYQYTRSAPKGGLVRPDSNVVIMLCPIEAGREEAISTSLKEAAFRKDLEDWQQLTGNIFIWDYVVQFRNFWNPFPNLHVLQPNLRYFRSHGVCQMFEQGTGSDNVTSWMEPRTYLIAKLLWNPNLDADSLLNDFCNGYYGAAGNYVKNIIDTMTAALVASGERLNIYGYAIDGCEGYLAPERINQYREMMRRAYAAATDSIVHQRLRFFELSLDFATVELAAGGAFYEELFPEGEKPDKVRQMYSMLNRMVDDLNRFGVSQMMEMGISPDQYRELIARYIEKTFSYSNSYFRPVELRKAPTEPYTCEGAQSLTDGASGILDYRNYWLGFYGDTLDAVISLGATDTVGHISMDFYFYPLSWIFLPQQIDYYISNDKENWRLVGRHTPENPEILATPMIKTFSTDLDQPTQAYYLRVVATPLPEIPQWHRAAGKPAWIFTDEILVESNPRKTEQPASGNGGRLVVNGGPQFLAPGDTVALISPSYYCDIEKVRAAADIIRQWGLVPILGPNVGRRANKQYAGTDRQRMDDIMWAYTNPSVKAIICNRGGYGSIHFLGEMDYSLLAKYQKWMVGYSDVTTLHSMAAMVGAMSIHGIMGGGIADCKGEGASVTLLRDMLFGTLPRYHTPHHKYNQHGTGRGTLVGGNLCTFAALSGTDCDATQLQDFILFIEEVGEDFHHIDRLFNTIIKRGVMKNCRGVILGDFTDCPAELGYSSVEEMLHHYLKDYDIPVLCGFPGGHGDTNLPLIMGATVEMKVNMLGGTITFDIDAPSREVRTAKPIDD